MTQRFFKARYSAHQDVFGVAAFRGCLPSGRGYLPGVAILPGVLILDGNNVLLADGKPDAMAGLDESSLVGWLARSTFARRTGGVLVVFDGPAHPGRRPQQAAGVRVVFSGSDTADERIAEAVRACSFPKQTTVVSGDRQVQKQARARKCRVLEGPAFLHELLRAIDGGGSDAALPTDSAGWLRDFGYDEEAEAAEREQDERPRTIDDEVDALLKDEPLPPELEPPENQRD